MRIVVVQTAFLGDIVLTTPLLRELCRAHPRASLTVVTTETGRQVLAGLPGVERLLVLDKGWRPAGVRSFLALLASLPRQRFDVAVAAQRSIRTGQIVWSTRAPLRIGFAGAPGAWAYHERVAWQAEDHAVRRYLALARPLGGEPATADPRPALAIDPAADRSIGSLLAAAGLAPGMPFLCVAPGSVRATKRWPPDAFAAVVRRLAGSGLRSVLAGAPGERALCERIAVESGARPLVLAGRTDVAGLVALAARAVAVLANDSGAGHVASAVGTPVVTIFGPTSPAAGYAPFGDEHRAVAHPALACRPCATRGPRACPLGHFRCMRELSAERVGAALAALLDGIHARARPPQARVRPG